MDFSQETNRDGIDETISEFDLHDTYLPQYAIAFQEGKAAGVMCSYNEVSKKYSAFPINRCKDRSKIGLNSL